ncbi:MAG: hypothetical protein MJZ33_01505 [Paludibacteraceae bacterium]|nr:hypothetical protein [Paludibacteraceae bacterium]
MAYFPDQVINAVWNKATAVDGYDSNIWRKDFAWIRRDHYGIRWFISHPYFDSTPQDVDPKK